MGRDRTCSKAMCPETAASYKSFAARAVPGRTRLSTASTSQRSAPAAERKKRGLAAGALLLVGARCGQTSAAWTSAGSEAFVAGRSLWTLKRDVRHPAAAEQAANGLAVTELQR